MSFISEQFVETANGASNYFKPQKGKSNKVRVLSDTPLYGFVHWTTDRRPVRWPYDGPRPSADFDPNERAKKFLAMVAWNYETESVQVWEVTQSSIINALHEISRDADFGHPVNYDLKITRQGEGLETTYQLFPVASPLTPELEDTMKTHGVLLEALFHGEDPFAS